MKNVFLITCFCLSALFAFNFEARAQRSAVSGAEVTGTFRNKTGSEFQILALGKGKLKIQFEGIYPYKVNGELTANTGEATGEADIAGDTATFIPDYSKEAKSNCIITLIFIKPGTFNAAQEETEIGCGFGHNVTANGTYRKISNKKPKFEQYNEK